RDVACAPTLPSAPLTVQSSPLNCPTSLSRSSTVAGSHSFTTPISSSLILPSDTVLRSVPTAHNRRATLRGRLIPKAEDSQPVRPSINRHPANFEFIRRLPGPPTRDPPPSRDVGI